MENRQPLASQILKPLSSVASVMSNSLGLHGMQSTRLLYLGDFPGKNTGVGCHFLLQGIFPTQGSNCLLCLLHCRQILYHYWNLGTSLKPLQMENWQGLLVEGKQTNKQTNRWCYVSNV